MRISKLLKVKAVAIAMSVGLLSTVSLVGLDTLFPVVLEGYNGALSSEEQLPSARAEYVDPALQAELQRLKDEGVKKKEALNVELAGVNDSIKQLIIEIDDLQNNQIAEVQIRLKFANDAVAKCKEKADAIQVRLDAAQRDKEVVEKLLNEATDKYVGARSAVGSIAREELRQTPDQVMASMILAANDSAQFVSTMQENDSMERISARLMKKAGENQVVFMSKSARLDALNEKIAEIKAEADENQKEAEAARNVVAAENAKLQGLKKEMQGKQKELEKERGDLSERISRTEAEIASADMSMQLLAMGVLGQLQVSINGFMPGYIISDDNFYTHGRMSVDQIQTFLNIQGAACQGDLCLKNYHATTHPKAERADAQCGPIAAGRNLSAAQIISEVSAACNINEQVLLVTLQKEQGLVTATNPALWKYKSAMGYGCPDDAACNPEFGAFFWQVYMAAWQFQKYRNAAPTYRFHAGRANFIGYHPDGGCGGKDVVIANNATVGLYNYTPYTPNDASLSAGFGLGDGCSSYGNRNFYLYFKGWFGSPV